MAKLGHGKNDKNGNARGKGGDGKDTDARETAAAVNGHEGPLTEKARKQALEMALGQIHKRCGQGSIMRLGQDVKVDVDVISTGSLSLDVATGVGGIPRGRVTEIFGPESSGKTTLALTVVSNAQKRGGVAAYVDAEHALDPGY